MPSWTPETLAMVTFALCASAPVLRTRVLAHRLLRQSPCCIPPGPRRWYAACVGGEEARQAENQARAEQVERGTEAAGLEMADLDPLHGQDDSGPRPPRGADSETDTRSSMPPRDLTSEHSWGSGAGVARSNSGDLLPVPLPPGITVSTEVDSMYEDGPHMDTATETRIAIEAAVTTMATATVTVGQRIGCRKGRNVA